VSPGISHSSSLVVAEMMVTFQFHCQALVGLRYQFNFVDDGTKATKIGVGYRLAMLAPCPFMPALEVVVRPEMVDPAVDCAPEGVYRIVMYPSLSL
jgi:hypothetical protein